MLIAQFIFLISSASFAKEVTVIQAGQMFLPAEKESQAEQIRKNPSQAKDAQLKNMTIKVGDSIAFKNLDKIAHNVYGEDFDLQAQKPGDTRSQSFTHEGHYSVRCAIHPKMKFDVQVEK